MAGLDVVRATAIIWVMLFHASGMGLLQGSDSWLTSFGWVGVDLFFVLSGFLIAGQLLQPVGDGRRIDYGRFLRRRALRTFPAYAAVVAVCFLFPTIRETPAIQPFWQFATFTENLFFDFGPKAFSHVWSLCVEEQFYTILPVIILLASIRPSARKTVAIFLGFVLIGMAARGYFYAARIGNPLSGGHIPPDRQAYMDYIYYPSWSRLDDLIAGVAIATLKAFRPVRWKCLTSAPDILLGVGIMGIGTTMCLFGGLVTTFVPAVIGYPLLAISIAAVVAAASVPESIVNRVSIPGAGFLASCSYSLYLTHKLAFMRVETLFPAILGDGWLGIAPAMLAALMVGGLLHFSIERPFLSLRDRIDSRLLRRSAGNPTEPTSSPGFARNSRDVARGPAAQ